MRDFLTMKDSLLIGFGRSFIRGFSQIASALGVSGDKLNELETVIDEYETALQEIRAARNHLKSLTTKKNGLRNKLKALIRSLTRKARSDSSLTDTQLSFVGLKPRDRIRTPGKTPETVPFITVEIKRNRQHVIGVYDYEDSTVKAKPEGVSGAEIWVYTGKADEMTEKNMRYIGTATRRRLSFTHDEEDAGKEAHFLARWINRRGERGMWSNKSSATIAH